ncbi:MAG: LysR family transcriptional regulator [Hydrogenophaga sp.]|uniref:LysR family transcriptional regulator n=1 Tax=Hydrogenophaga sp. TaxID=1904254 RepID=UPI001BB9170F|nr:LysR family transcriptional regulator [Hydrogenophaga sp.]MBS3910601.1 LysR family transcriptional regulator [Hydrogenophaga sp.]MDP2163165.1 LysR family transcriptional regulator [Hydrogenophaga sp.]MDP3476232.1 LysR family transcriptional regulator [Hydrogenophaga sp.]
MEFRHLRCFTVLAEELHFGRAAQRLAITQPPLSLNIQQLEASVGARLFERNSRGVALTAAGLAFLPRAQALLEQAAMAAREARDVGQGLAGQLHIGFAGTVLYRGLPQVLRAFGSAHPRLRLVLRELSSSEQLVELVHDRLDLGFVHTTRVPAGFSQILVSSQPFMACLPVGHALAAQAVLPLERLKGEAFAVVMRAVSPDYHDRILAACADAGFEPALHFELRHWLSVVSVIAQGLGVALVPAALQQAGLPGVAFVPLAQPLAPYDTHCLWRTGRDEVALGAFLATVRAAAQPG